MKDLVRHSALAAVVVTGAVKDIIWACPGSVDGYGLGFQALCCNCLLS